MSDKLVEMSPFMLSLSKHVPAVFSNLLLSVPDNEREYKMTGLAVFEFFDDLVTHSAARQQRR
jgi:hypothetical protein